MQKMRRINLQMTNENAMHLLKGEQFGVLATVDKNNQPYGVPLDYVVLNNHIYTHGALEGHKLDNILANDKVSFTVIGTAKPIHHEYFTTKFASVIVFGKASIVKDDKEKTEALKALSEKFFPELMDKFDGEMDKFFKITSIIKISIDHITGKDNTSSK